MSAPITESYERWSSSGLVLVTVTITLVGDPASDRGAYSERVEAAKMVREFANKLEESALGCLGIQGGTQ